MSKGNLDPLKILVLNCTVCPFVTQKVERLYSHIELFHPRTIRVDFYQCESCSVVATSQELIEEHIEAHHPTANDMVHTKLLFSKTVNETRGGSIAAAHTSPTDPQAKQPRPVLGRGGEGDNTTGLGAEGQHGMNMMLGGSQPYQPGTWVCSVCNNIFDSEQAYTAHQLQKHSAGGTPDLAGKVPNPSDDVPSLPVIDLRYQLRNSPCQLTSLGHYVIDQDKKGVYANIKYYPNFFSKTDADRFDRVLSKNDKLNWQQRKSTSRDTGKDRPEPRLTSYVGPPYEYAGLRWDENGDWPAELQEIKNLVERFTGFTFNSVLGTMYRNGYDSIGWHADDEPELGKHPAIASISFGASRFFELTKVGPQPAVVGVRLNHGDLLLTYGCVQERWKHRVAKDTTCRWRRINFTFRTVNPNLRKARKPGTEGGAELGDERNKASCSEGGSPAEVSTAANGGAEGSSNGSGAAN